MDPEGNAYLMGGSVYCPGAFSNNYVQMFDIQNQTWTYLPSLNNGHYGLPGFYMQNRLYYVSEYLECLNLQDLDSGWTNCGDAPSEAIRYAAICVAQYWAWMSGGRQGLHISNALYRWQPGHTTWQEMAAMSSAQYEHQMACTDDYIYVIGDENINMQRYDITSDAWSQLGSPLSYYRFSTGALYLPWNQIIAPTGRDDSQNNDGESTVLRYDISTGIWAQISNVVKTPVIDTSVVLLP